MSNNEQHDDGGPAFACAGHSPDCGQMFQSGMSLRDWYAGMAMQGEIASTSEGWSEVDLAYRAYSIADAMLKTRGTK